MTALEATVPTGAVDLARRERTKDKLRQGFILVKEALQELAEDGVSATEAHAICNEVKEGIVGLSTVKRHYKAFKDAGIYTPKLSDKPKAVQKRKERARQQATKAQNEPMSHVPPTTYKHDFNPVQDTTVLEPRVLDADVVEDSQEWESVVPMGTEADRDYQECLELFQQLFKITGKYITGGWSEQQWNALGGECRTLEDGCNIHSANLRKAIERDVRGFSDALNEARTQSICQGSSNTGS